MKHLTLAAVLFCLVASNSAYAQSMNKTTDSKQSSPGATGAMNNSNSNGVATDPGGVQAQEKGAAKASPGTVGAAPDADTKSQTNK